MAFFTHERLTPRITRIKDICNTFIYLVEGDERAALLDTGDGFGDLAAYVAALTQKPITAVLTHGHLDHVAGVAPFDDVYLNTKDLDLYREHGQVAFRLAHSPQAAATTPPELVAPYREPDGFKPLCEGTVIDLGGVHLRAIEVPGHTPGMICVLIEEERYCLFGDACGVFVLLADDRASCVSEYLASLEHLKTFEDRYDFVIRNHGTGESPKDLLDNVMDCCKRVLAGTDDHVPTVFNGTELFVASAQDPSGHGRVDGKEGNLVYRADKAH